jgi:hypothetical protein
MTIHDIISQGYQYVAQVVVRKRTAGTSGGRLYFETLRYHVAPEDRNGVLQLQQPQHPVYVDDSEKRAIRVADAADIARMFDAVRQSNAAHCAGARDMEAQWTC